MLDVDVARHDHRLAVVDGLELGELIRVRFDQVGQPVQQPLPVDGLHSRPVAVLEGAARGGHGPIHVGGIAQGAVAR